MKSKIRCDAYSELFLTTPFCEIGVGMFFSNIGNPNKHTEEEPNQPSSSLRFPNQVPISLTNHSRTPYPAMNSCIFIFFFFFFHTLDSSQIHKSPIKQKGNLSKQSIIIHTSSSPNTSYQIASHHHISVQNPFREID